LWNVKEMIYSSSSNSVSQELYPVAFFYKKLFYKKLVLKYNKHGNSYNILD